MELMMWIVVIVAIIFCVIHFYVPRFITEIRNPLSKILRAKSLKQFLPELIEGKREIISFVAEDGILIQGIYTFSKQEKVKGTLILMHGIRSSNENFVTVSERLSDEGYNSIALDLRAHGWSEGVHCTFGVKEKQDVSLLIDILEKEKGTGQCIGVWGQSLGGAIGLQALGTDPRIKFGIIESTFSDFRVITNDYFRMYLGFNIKPLTNYLVYRSGKIAGFNPHDAVPINYCQHIQQPVLIVHGKKDRRIKIKRGRNNFEAISSINKEFIQVENANHMNVWEIGGESYFKRVIEFIDKQAEKPMG